MITTDGKLILGDETITPFMDINEFRELPIIRNVKETKSPSYEHFYLFYRVEHEELSYSINFYFRSNCLYMINLGVYKEHKMPEWKDWSLENEYDKQIFFDQWLKEQLGEKPYDYAWGRVRSVFDPKNQVAFILVEYQKEQITNKWWQGFNKK